MIPAFPRPYSVDEIDPEISYPAHVGMDLRDYFAAKAMQGFASTIGTVIEPDWRMMARDAYVLADAMMEARDAK